VHITEGILSPPVMACGWAAAGAATAVCLRSLDEERIPRTAVLTACFFAGGLIHLRIGPASVHFVLNGLCGVILGPAAFPAIVVGLLLQCLLLASGGVSTLGVNACIMGFPALGAWAGMRLWRSTAWGRTRGGTLLGAFAAGFGGVAAGSLLLVGALLTTGDELARIAPYILAPHAAIAVIEGLLTAGVASFLLRVRPAMLEGGAHA